MRALLAQSAFALARALWAAPVGDGRDHVRAVALAREAAAHLRDMPDKEAAQARIAGWLAKHR